MRVFKDAAERSWEIAVTVASARRVKDLAGVDLLGLLGEIDRYAAFLGDPYARANALYALVKPQADALGLSDDEFGASLGGDAMETATAALQEELIDFFPKAKRPALRELMGTMERAAGILSEKALKRLQETDLAGEAQKILEAMTSAGSSRATSGTAPASSESIPEVSPCGSSS